VSASKFTPEIRGALIERTAAGVSLPDACRAVGVREGTVKSWLTRGRREGSGAYAEFAQQIEQAREAVRSRPESMDEDELRQRVSEMVRGGSVQGAKLYWEMLRAGQSEDAPAEVDPFDAVAERRLKVVGGDG
jgi:transposase